MNYLSDTGDPQREREGAGTQKMVKGPGNKI